MKTEDFELVAGAWHAAMRLRDIASTDDEFLSLVQATRKQVGLLYDRALALGVFPRDAVIPSSGHDPFACKECGATSHSDGAVLVKEAGWHLPSCSFARGTRQTEVTWEPASGASTIKHVIVGEDVEGDGEPWVDANSVRFRDGDTFELRETVGGRLQARLIRTTRECLTCGGSGDCARCRGLGRVDAPLPPRV